LTVKAGGRLAPPPPPARRVHAYVPRAARKNNAEDSFIVED